MKILKKLIFAVCLLFLLTAGCIFYAFRIEPFRISVNTFAMGAEESSAEPVQIVQISDIHIKEDFTYKNLEKIVERCNRLSPDFVVFTGDLYDNYAKYSDDSHLISELKKLHAEYGKIAIWGNRDYGGGAVRKYQEIMELSGFTLLKNERMFITTKNGKKIQFTGLDDALLGQPSMPDMTGTDAADFKILLTHEPDSVLTFPDSGHPLILSGHSHGGQVRIPFLPFVNERAVAATSLSSKYSGGMYRVGEEGKQKLYVNTGLGTTHISARFGVVPEITVFEIYI